MNRIETENEEKIDSEDNNTVIKSFFYCLFRSSTKFFFSFCNLQTLAPIHPKDSNEIFASSLSPWIASQELGENFVYFLERVEVKNKNACMCVKDCINEESCVCKLVNIFLGILNSAGWGVFFVFQGKLRGRNNCFIICSGFLFVFFFLFINYNFYFLNNWPWDKKKK